MILDELRKPIVQAPLAGGPSTVELAEAVSRAGGLGFLAGGYLTAEAMASQIEQLQLRRLEPFGVNIFAPPHAAADPTLVGAYARRLAAETDRYGVPLGTPYTSDDHWQAKLTVLERARPAVLSFTFGCPSAEVVARLREREIEVWVTITTPKEAQKAEQAGATAIVVQGVEAGGHRGGFEDAAAAEQFGLLSLLRLVASVSRLPMVATGGISDGYSVAAVLAAGARAAQIGTAFMLTPEAGTSSAQRFALLQERPTAMTRAFTGRQARGIRNRFLDEHSLDAPAAYPEVHYLTAPIRAAAREKSDPDGFNLWAGQSHALARPIPAAQLVQTLTTDASTALAQATRHLPKAAK
jgi:nitronate monooxygenase